MSKKKEEIKKIIKSKKIYSNTNVYIILCRYIILTFLKLFGYEKS